jgi:hypothetical protein
MVLVVSSRNFDIAAETHNVFAMLTVRENARTLKLLIQDRGHFRLSVHCRVRQRRQPFVIRGEKRDLRSRTGLLCCHD